MNFPNTSPIPLVKGEALIPISLSYEPYNQSTFVAISDGTKIEKPKFMQQKRKKIARWQEIVARREKGSRRREKAKERLQGAYMEATNQSDDYLHKLSNILVNSGYTSFAEEAHAACGWEDVTTSSGFILQQIQAVQVCYAQPCRCLGWAFTLEEFNGKGRVFAFHASLSLR